MDVKKRETLFRELVNLVGAEALVGRKSKKGILKDACGVIKGRAQHKKFKKLLSNLREKDFEERSNII